MKDNDKDPDVSSGMVQVMGFTRSRPSLSHNARTTCKPGSFSLSFVMLLHKKPHQQYPWTPVACPWMASRGREPPQMTSQR